MVHAVQLEGVYPTKKRRTEPDQPKESGAYKTTLEFAKKRFFSETPEGQNPPPSLKRRTVEIEAPLELPPHVAFVLSSHKKQDKELAKFREAIESLEETDATRKKVKKLLLQRLDKSLEGDFKIPLPSVYETEIKSMEEKHGFLASQLFKELLLSLKSLDKLKKEEGKFIIELAKNILSTLSNVKIEEDNPLEIYLDSSQISPELYLMGCLLFVIEKKPETIQRLEKVDSLDEQYSLLEKVTENELNKLAKDLERHKEAHRSYKLQHEDEAYLIELSKILAHILLTPSGVLNLPLCQKVLKKMIPQSMQSYISIQDITRTLETVMVSNDMQEALRSAVPPAVELEEMPFAIRTSLGLDSKTELTSSHARQFILSGLLSHIRQGSAGTCFATSFMIKLWNEELKMALDDLIEYVETGFLPQKEYGYEKTIPFRALLTDEYLDTVITLNEKGNVKSIKRGKKKPYFTLNYKLSHAPGMQAVFNTLQIAEGEKTIECVKAKLGTEFSIKQLITQLGEFAFEAQKERRDIRSVKQLTLEEFIARGKFAYCAETNHPLIRGFEQALATGVNYFASPECMPHWIFESFENIVSPLTHGKPPLFRTMFKKLLSESFLPLITRMKYLYNPSMDNEFILFPEKHYGTRAYANYGYELVDAGLPEDFEYSNELYKRLKASSGSIPIHRFEEYLIVEEWETIPSGIEFQKFLKDVLNETAQFLKKDVTFEEDTQLNEVLVALENKIDSPKFVDDVVIKIYPHDKKHKIAHLKNPHKEVTTPWVFHWGGSVNHVMGAFYNAKSRVKSISFIGSCFDVLSRTIEYLKNQPSHIREAYSSTYQRIPIESPVHAFLLTPRETSLVAAWTSELSTRSYIEQNVIEPGIRIAQSPITKSQSLTLLDYFSKQSWFNRSNEKEDYERIQLTDFSKEVFDQLCQEDQGLVQLSLEDFEKKITLFIAQARAQDPKIGHRNPYWERRAHAVFRNKIELLLGKGAEQRAFTPSIAKELITFARNQVDSRKISDGAMAKILDEMKSLERGLSIQKFRDHLLNVAVRVQTEEKGYKDKKWKEALGVTIDDKLFSLLNQEMKDVIINSGIVAYDTNWKKGIHDIHFMFAVNPGSGKLELCMYIPDLKELSFREQPEWFPNGKVGRRWTFPDNFRDLSRKEH